MLLVIADALSQAPRTKEVVNNVELVKEVKCLMVVSLPATSQRLAEYTKAQSIDLVCFK